MVVLVLYVSRLVCEVQSSSWEALVVVKVLEEG